MYTYFRNEDKSLVCADGKYCAKIYSVINEKKSLVDTFPLAEM